MLFAVMESTVKDSVEEDGGRKAPTLQLRLPIRRKLFGDVDHEMNRRDLRHHLEVVHAEKKRKWNFDFSESRPMEGPFEWSLEENCVNLHDEGSNPPRVDYSASMYGDLPETPECIFTTISSSVSISNASASSTPRSKRQTTLNKYFPVKKRVENQKGSK